MSEAQDIQEELVFECDLEAPPAKVWRALSVPELREAWLGEPDAGPAKVLRADPDSQLVLDWPSDGRDSTVTFEIAPGEDGGTHLRIVHAPRTLAVVVPFPTQRGARAVMAASAQAFRKAA